MAGARSSFKGVLADFPMSILSKIYGEPTREGLIDLHKLISGNAASVASNQGGGQHGHLALTMTAYEYRSHTGFAFVPPHNPGDYPQSMGSAQEQALGTEKFQQKSSDASQIHRRGRSLEKADHHGGGTSIPIPTGGSAHRVRTGVRT